MWRMVSLLALSAFAFVPGAPAEDGAVHYYVQLVRGTDAAQPPQNGSHLIGPKLAATFGGVLKWKHYWEICRKEVDVSPGGTAKINLTYGHEVQIDRTKPGKRTVAAYQEGHLVERTIGPLGQAMTLIGGHRDATSVWFIVVRRDKPVE